MERSGVGMSRIPREPVEGKGEIDDASETLERQLAQRALPDLPDANNPLRNRETPERIDVIGTITADCEAHGGDSGFVGSAEDRRPVGVVSAREWGEASRAIVRPTWSGPNLPAARSRTTSRRQPCRQEGSVHGRPIEVGFAP